MASVTEGDIKTKLENEQLSGSALLVNYRSNFVLLAECVNRVKASLFTGSLLLESFSLQTCNSS